LLHPLVCIPHHHRLSLTLPLVPLTKSGTSLIVGEVSQVKT
jgi:hypothetical protein